MALVSTSLILLLSTSITLAYSIKFYYGGFLHSIPELMAASCVSIILMGLAWLPSNELPGAFGLDCMRYVWQELVWSSILSIELFFGLVSMHESTPGLMTSCGRFFICRGYIFVFVSAWFSWLFITIPTVILGAAVIYQSMKRISSQPIWKFDIARFEYFWPGQAHLKSMLRKSMMNPESLPRVSPDVEGMKSGHSLFCFDHEKSLHSGFDH